MQQKTLDLKLASFSAQINTTHHTKQARMETETDINQKLK